MRSGSLRAIETEIKGGVKKAVPVRSRAAAQRRLSLSFVGRLKSNDRLLQAQKGKGPGDGACQRKLLAKNDSDTCRRGKEAKNAAVKNAGG